MKYKLGVFLHLKHPPTFLGLYAPEALLLFSNQVKLHVGAPLKKKTWFGPHHKPPWNDSLSFCLC